MIDIHDLFWWGMDRQVPSIVGPHGPEDDADAYMRPFCLNLGAGNKEINWPIGWEVENLDLPEWDADDDGLNKFDSSSVDGIFAFHFLEHLIDPVSMLWECQRVLRVGGVMSIVVPYYTAQIMAHDLDHKHPFCEDTWKVLFNTPYYDKNKVGPSGESWSFDIGFNMIMGIVERNLVLVTQLIKT